MFQWFGWKMIVTLLLGTVCQLLILHFDVGWPNFKYRPYCNCLVICTSGFVKLALFFSLNLSLLSLAMSSIRILSYLNSDNFHLNINWTIELNSSVGNLSNWKLWKISDSFIWNSWSSSKMHDNCAKNKSVSSSGKIQQAWKSEKVEVDDIGYLIWNA